MPKPFIDIVELQPIELSGRWKDEDAPAPCRSLTPDEVKLAPPPEETKKELPGSQYQWDRGR